MIKLILKHLWYGITWGCVVLLVWIVWWDVTDSINLQHFFDNPTSSTLGFVVMFIGLVGGGIVYDIERIGFFMKLVIHILLGIGFLLLGGFIIGWFTMESPAIIVYNIAVNVLILFAIWVGCYFYDKRRVKRINQKLQERNAMRELDTE